MILGLFQFPSQRSPQQGSWGIPGRQVLGSVGEGLGRGLYRSSPSCRLFGWGLISDSM